MDLISALFNLFQLRSFIILGLILQSIVTLLSPLRKMSANGALLMVIWLTYTLAGLISDYSAGLVTYAAISKQMNHSTSTSNSTQPLIALWTPYILLQVVGPDTISAASMDDNYMWSRYSLRLSLTAYFLHRSFLVLLPKTLIAVALYLAYVAGLLRYVVSCFSLYYANSALLRVFNLPIKESAPPLHDPEVTRDAIYFFKKFKGVFANVVFSPQEQSESRAYFLSKDAEHAFSVVKTELNLAYDLFFTKSVVIRFRFGFLARFIAVVFELVALFIWVFVDKTGFNRGDVQITWAIVFSTVALDAVTFIMLLFSDWTVARAMRSQSLYSLLIIRAVAFMNKYRCIRLLSRRSSETIAQYSFIKCCTNPKLENLLGLWKIKDWLQGWRYVSSLRYAYKKRVDEISNLRTFIFQQLEYRSRKAIDNPALVEEMCSERGDWFLREHYRNSRVISRFADSCWFSESRPFERNVVIWHIATEFCYSAWDGDDEGEEKRELSRVISGYMMYIILLQPGMVVGVTGESKIAFQAACEEVARKVSGCGDKKERYKRAYEKIMEDQIEEWVVEDARRLVEEIQGIKEQGGNEWEVMSHVWMQMLCYAASNSKASEHAAQLCKGGELISEIWLLMVHLGLGKQLLYSSADSTAPPSTVAQPYHDFSPVRCSWSVAADAPSPSVSSWPLDLHPPRLDRRPCSAPPRLAICEVLH